MARPHVSELAPLLSSDRTDWETPTVVLDLVRRVAPIALDPCTTDKNPTGAKRYYTPAGNGLQQHWVALDGLIYVNPPYGREIGKWTLACAGAGANGNELIALLPSRTDTKWWRLSVERADSLCFWSGRLTFAGAPDPAPFPSVLAYWGERRKRFDTVFRPHGWIR